MLGNDVVALIETFHPLYQLPLLVMLNINPCTLVWKILVLFLGARGV